METFCCVIKSCYSQIARVDIVQFKRGKNVPACTVELEWTGSGEPKPLSHQVKITGAKKLEYFYIRYYPRGFFLLLPPSLSLPPSFPPSLSDSLSLSLSLSPLVSINLLHICVVSAIFIDTTASTAPAIENITSTSPRPTNQGR